MIHENKYPVSVLVLQNVHRGGQGQFRALTSAYDISSFASSSPSPFSISFAGSLSQQQQQRPTTYRPLLRRDDQIQVVRAVEDAQAFEQLRSQAQSPTTDYQSHYYRGTDETSPSTSSSVFRQPVTARSRLSDPQNSYARLLHFQGDRRTDSFVRYWKRPYESTERGHLSCPSVFSTWKIPFAFIALNLLRTLFRKFPIFQHLPKSLCHVVLKWCVIMIWNIKIYFVRYICIWRKKRDF